ERLQQMMVIILEQGIHVEALQTKYPIIDWDIYTKGTRQYWKIIRVDSKAGEESSKEGESLKRHAKKELGQEQQKKQKVKEDLSQERLQQMMVIILEQGIHVEALQTKYPIIDWDIYTKGTRQYWKIIRVGNITEVHQFFVDMIKAFNREDLVRL
nr:hypothetical protein [Tanacetum cinerariifolium]